MGSRTTMFISWTVIMSGLNYFFDNNPEAWKLMIHQLSAIGIFTWSHWLNERIES